MKLQITSYSDIGGRRQNEDSVLTAEQNGCTLLMAADGLGGCAAGEVASRIAVETVQELFTAQGAETDLRGALIEANQRILAEQQQTGRHMMTTAAVVLITPERLYLAHVGDTRIYLFREGEIIHQSLDHSVPQEAVARGEITPEEIRSHEARNVITRALGAEEIIKVETAELPPDAADAMLLCTDGFWEYILESDMTEALRQTATPEEWLDAMRKLHASRVRGRHDNNTAAVAMFLQE